MQNLWDFQHLYLEIYHCLDGANIWRYSSFMVLGILVTKGVHYKDDPQGLDNLVEKLDFDRFLYHVLLLSRLTQKNVNFVDL